MNARCWLSSSNDPCREVPVFKQQRWQLRVVDPWWLNWTIFERWLSTRCRLAECRHICRWRKERKLSINLESSPLGRNVVNTHKAGASHRIENVPKSDAAVKSQRNSRSRTIATKPQSWSSWKIIFMVKNYSREILHLKAATFVLFLCWKRDISQIEMEKDACNETYFHVVKGSSRTKHRSTQHFELNGKEMRIYCSFH